MMGYEASVNKYFSIIIPVHVSEEFSGEIIAD